MHKLKLNIEEVTITINKRHAYSILNVLNPAFQKDLDLRNKEMDAYDFRNLLSSSFMSGITGVHTPHDRD